MKIPCVLAIAGSDSCGGAGIQADIKTIQGLGARALTALTALTAQNSRGIRGIHVVPPEFIVEQVDAVLEDLTPDAVKVGMVFTAGAVKAVAGLIERYMLRNVVLDPLLRASTGRDLLEPEAWGLLKARLLPLARVITPNLTEAGVLLGREIINLEGAVQGARKLKSLGPDVVVTGGHLQGGPVDVLYSGDTLRTYPGDRIEERETHGSGCVFSSALAVFLGAGWELPEAVGAAGECTRQAIRGSVLTRPDVSRKSYADIEACEE